MADALRLALTTFPQHWDGKGTVTLNVVVCVPLEGDTLAEVSGGAFP